VAEEEEEEETMLCRSISLEAKAHEHHCESAQKRCGGTQKCRDGGAKQKRGHGDHPHPDIYRDNDHHTYTTP
jgi:hypothetical protein